MDIANNIAGGLASGAASAGISSLFNIGQNRKAFMQAKHMQRKQHKNQMMLNRQGMELGKEMWDYTNFENQMKRLKEAGLSAGLIYGQGGQGGSTSMPGGGSAAGGGAPAPPYMDIGTLAQVELMKAQAKKAEAEAEYIGGQGTELAGAQAANLLQGITNQQTINDLNKIQRDIDIATRTDQIVRIAAEADSALAQAKISRS